MYIYKYVTCGVCANEKKKKLTFFQIENDISFLIVLQMKVWTVKLGIKHAMEGHMSLRLQSPYGCWNFFKIEWPKCKYSVFAYLVRVVTQNIF